MSPGGTRGAPSPSARQMASRARPRAAGGKMGPDIRHTNLDPLAILPLAMP